MQFQVCKFNIKLNLIISSLRDIYILLSQESKILNVQSLKGIQTFIHYSVSLFLILRLIRDCIEQETLNLIEDTIGLLLICILKYYKNDKKVTYYTLIITFWCASVGYIFEAYLLDITKDQMINNIWVYETIIEAFTPLLSLKFQIIHKIIYHILIGKIGILQYNNVISQIIEIIMAIIIVLFNLIGYIYKMSHSEKEFQKKQFYEDIQYSQPGKSYKIAKDSNDHITILESNRTKSYKKFVDNITKKNLKYEHPLPFEAISFIDIIELLINDQTDERQSFKITAISYKGKPNQKKLQIHIMKQLENYQTVIFLRINELDLEEQIELMKTRELMFNSINHDVKNPLIAGSLLIQQIILQHSNAAIINQDDLQSLQYYYDMSQSLIDGYFDYTLAQLGNLKIQPEKFLLYEPITNTIKMMQQIALKKSINLISQFDVEKIFGKNDVRKISQVLMNLINNAIKFTENVGQVKVHIQEFINKNLIYISVIDTGVGMSPQIIEKIGQLYATFDNRNMNSQGTGIGLYTSIITVGLIGPIEKIFISSVEGQGSEFSFFVYINSENITIKSIIERFDNNIGHILSYLKNDEVIVYKTKSGNEIFIAEEQTIKTISNKSSIFQSKYNDDQMNSTPKMKTTIMIVDDEEIIRRATINAVKKLGFENYNILQAQNGQVGLDLFKKHNEKKNQSPIDLIFTDIQMPELDGFGMITQINELIVKNNYLKPQIIVLSSNQSNEHIKKCKELNIYQNYNKPQTAQQIRELITQFENQKNSV